MKYTGNDYDKDMAEIAADPETQRWWKLTDGMQESFVDGATGSGKEIPWWMVCGFLLILFHISDTSTSCRTWTKSFVLRGSPKSIIVT
jgi:hypothetical protein